MVEEASRVMEDMTSIMASVIGFDAKYDSSMTMMNDEDYNKQFEVKHQEMINSEKQKKLEQRAQQQ